MTLDDYLALPDAMTLTRLASEIGISKARLSQIRKEGRWPPEHALAAEKATGGVISASELCPIIAQARL